MCCDVGGCNGCKWYSDVVLLPPNGETVIGDEDDVDDVNVVDDKSYDRWWWWVFLLK